MKRIKLFFSIAFILVSCSGDIEKSIDSIDHDIYEMRVYYTYDGKFNDIISRFENHTTKLFEK
ncbi:MAG: NIPSNAP family protein, partial [Flavobacteriaceae bacterium]|nr:NIPSNAP family protein [Flavobacteriaceae bacterium]